MNYEHTYTYVRIILRTSWLTSVYEDGVFDDCQCSDHEVDDIESIDSQLSVLV